MVEIRISGGLGNQLFQYAFGYAIAKKIDQELILDISYFDYDCLREYKLNQFCIEDVKEISYMDRLETKGIKRYVQMLNCIMKKRKKLSTYEKVEDSDFSMNNLKDKNYYFRGFWQNEEYFKEYAEEIRKQFLPSGCLGKEYHCWRERIEREESVSIHIRRTDYIKYGAAIQPEFYISAIKKMLELTKCKKCFVFTDDVVWTTAMIEALQFPVDIEFVSGNEGLTDIEEMMLMSRCKHHIIANSSFSWWGAWLGDDKDKVVIAPKVKVWNENFYPSNWILINAEIEAGEQIVKQNQNVKARIISQVKEFGYL